MDANYRSRYWYGNRRFNPRARDGRESTASSAKPVMACFNPRARDGRESVNDFINVLN